MGRYNDEILPTVTPLATSNDDDDNSECSVDSSSEGSVNSDEAKIVDNDWTPHPIYNRKKTTVAIQTSTTIRRKRTYRFLSRVCRRRDPTCRMRERWLNGLPTYSDQEISSLGCCSRKCFTVVNMRFLRQKINLYLKLTYPERRQVLLHMISSKGTYIFDNNSVCSKFLETAFRFSPQMQAAVRKLENPLLDYFTKSTIKSLSMDSSRFSTDMISNQKPLSQDSIIIFLARLASETAEMMPDKPQQHLPFFRTTDVYEVFMKEFSFLKPEVHFPSYSYFMRIWKKYSSHIQIRKWTRFTKCTTCEQLRSTISEAVRSGKSTIQLRKQQERHQEFVKIERREYTSKKEMATLRPKEILSVVVDGADQTAFSLPHFSTPVKDTRGHGLKVHLIGLLHHGAKNHLRLFTMNDNHETGSNHIVEVIHRYINNLSKRGPLPKMFYIQADNCVRENKNRYFLAYLEGLVKRRVFDVIQVSFLPIGHTHTDIDQAFSTTSDRLRHNDAVTMKDMEMQLSNCYNDSTVVTSLKEVVNWSGLCNEQRCLTKVKNITMWRYFRITSKKTSSSNSEVKSVCHVKSCAQDAWSELETDGDPQFLLFIPDLSKTPPEILRSPTNIEEVTSRINSEESRIKSDEKLQALLALRDEVYQDRHVDFHWDLSDIVELQTRNHEDGSEEELSPDAPLYGSDFKYPSGCFVAVRSGQSEFDLDFWVAEVIDSHKGYGTLSGSVVALTVLWYTATGSSNIYSARYRPWIIDNVPWKSKISTSSVFVKFDSLTSTRSLPMNVSTHLRTSVQNSKEPFDE